MLSSNSEQAKESISLSLSEYPESVLAKLETENDFWTQSDDPRDTLMKLRILLSSIFSR